MYTKAAIAMAILALTASALDTNGWFPVRVPAASDRVQVTVAVKQANLDVVDRLFWAVSNPESEMYGRFLTHEQVGDLVSNPDATEAVVNALLLHGAQDLDLSPHGEYVSASVRVQDAEKLFKAKFFEYEHDQLQGSIIRAERFEIPEHLRVAVHDVAHMDYFPTARPAAANASSLAAAASGQVVPSTLTDYYGIDNTKTTGLATQSLFEGLGQSFSPDDLTAFQKQYDLEQNAISDVIGPNKPKICSLNPNSCGEANLDVQYMMSVAQDAPTTFWSIASSSQDPFTDWAKAVASDANPPYVHSMSYGGYEADQQSMDTFNTEVQKLGLRGVSVMVSSGDDGVANFQARSDSSQCGYNPSFPATSPYVTAVGATQGPEDGSDEIACSSKTSGLITTGGGFSGVYSRPSYQDDAVAGYFQNVATQPVSGYNANGRGIPDVSAMGHNYVIVDGGQQLVVSGTSASSPVFAAMITLINDARLAKGKQPLGFLNQALYSLDASVWNDVTSGENNCCAQSLFRTVCCSEGFSAARGWDPLTGLGSPKFAKLSSALVDL